MKSAFRDGVLELARHRPLVDAGGHEHDAAAAARVVVLRGELLDEQQRRAHVLGEECVELGCRRVGEAAAPAACVVHDEHIERRAELRACSVDDSMRRIRVREIGLDVADPELPSHALGAVRLGSPFLRRIVWRPALEEDARAALEQPLRNRKADPRAATGACNERVPSSQVHVERP